VLGPEVYPDGFAVTSDGTHLCAAASQVGREPFAYMMVINTRTYNYTTFGGPSFPGNDGEVAISPDGSRVYVASGDPGAVPFYSTAAGHALLGSLPVPPPTLGAFAVSPDGGRIYRTTEGPTLMVFDAAANALLAEIPIGGEIPGFGGVSVTPDGSKVYVTNSRQNTVVVIDAATYAITKAIPVGHDPLAFGNVIQEVPKFAGKPGSANCYSSSIAALAKQFGGLNGAAQNYPSVSALENEVFAFCEG
jgi:YVTN family beta-propeller protein